MPSLAGTTTLIYLPSLSAHEAPSSHTAHRTALVPAHLAPVSPLTPPPLHTPPGWQQPPCVPWETTTSLPWQSLQSFTCQTGSVHLPWIRSSPLTQLMPDPLTQTPGPTHTFDLTSLQSRLHLLYLTLPVTSIVRKTGYFVYCNINEL